MVTKPSTTESRLIESAGECEPEVRSRADQRLMRCAWCYILLAQPHPWYDKDTGMLWGLCRRCVPGGLLYY